MPCGCFPTGMRTISFSEIGSMIDVVFAMRLFTATKRPSGDTAIWCGMRPTGIFAIVVYSLPGAASMTQT